MKNKLKSFTLVEVVVAVGLFAVLFVVIGGTFYASINAWTRQKNTLQLVQDARTALDMICDEVRHTQRDVTAPPPVSLLGLYDNDDDGDTTEDARAFYIVIDGDGDGDADDWVWYWYYLLDTPPDYKIYRGVDIDSGGASLPASFTNAEGNSSVLIAGVDVDPGNIIFNLDLNNEVLTIDLKVRPHPDQLEGHLNRNITVQTKVRVRN